MNYHEIINTLIFHRKKIILFTFFTSVFLFLLLLFVYPITYSAEVKILPPEDNKYGGIQGILGGADLPDLFGFTGSGGNSQLFAEILKSRTASEFVIQECDLMEYFDVDDVQRASKMLQKKINVEVTKERIIILNTELTTPLFSRYSDVSDSVNNLTAKVANSFVDALDKINQQKLNLRAKNTREYIENQLILTEEKLQNVEDSLKRFQEINKAISLPEQLRAALETAAKVKTEIILTEIQLNTLAYNLKRDNKEIESLQRRLKVLNEKYAEMEAGDNLNKDYLPVFDDIPAVSLEFAQLARELKVQNEVYILLQKQFYMEKIQENKDIPTVEILDNALPSLKAKSPRLIFHTMMGGIFAFLLISAVILYSENKNKNLMKK